MAGIKRKTKRAAARYLTSALLLAFTAPIGAAPWAGVGDRTLRSDIEILASRGLIDGVVTTWPIPAGQLQHLPNITRVAREPPYVLAAARRVLDWLNRSQGLKPTLDVRVASEPETVRDFGANARNQVDAKAGLDWTGDWAAIGINVGEQARFNRDEKNFSLDGSYVSLDFANARIYGGYVDQWYGPGEISSLLLSNNARPFPKFGIMRDDPHAFETPWLSWIGPWQVNFFVGLLDGPRIDRHTAFSSLRITFEPINNLEIGLTRLTELCGANHPCHPLKSWFHFRNDDRAGGLNETNEEAGIDFKYTLALHTVSISPYVQFMNEDTGPFTHSATSYLGGATMVGPFGDFSAHWRLTGEYTDSVATKNWFGFGDLFHGAAYNNGGYVDGFRYRDRTTGFSLDSDSHLLSVVGSVTDSAGWMYRLVYHHARISTPELAAAQLSEPNTRNSVSSVPLTINQVEAGLSVPWHGFTLEASVRGQDDQVAPRHGKAVQGEAGIRYGF